MMRSSSRDGVTLLELVVALAIIGMGSAVAMLAWRAQDSSALEADAAVARLVSDARQQAITSGRVQRVAFRLTPGGEVLDVNELAAGSVEHRLVAFPDGAVIADSSLRLDQLGSRSRAIPERAR